MDKNQCKICKLRAYILCDQCDSYFCSRGHLHSHKIKEHKFVRSNSNSKYSSINNEKSDKLKKENTNENDIDLRKLYEHLQNLKNEIDLKLKDKNFVDGILIINKALVLAKKFYKEDDLFV